MAWGLSCIHLNDGLVPRLIVDSKCGRRFQIFRVFPRVKRSASTRLSSIDSNHTIDARTDLIRNFRVQQSRFPCTHSPDPLFQCLWEHCNHIIFAQRLSTHLRECHGIRGANKMLVNCLWDYCNSELNEEMLSRHVESVHLGVA